MVGQILEYGAQACGWSATDIEARAHKFLSNPACPQEYGGLSLEEALRLFLEKSGAPLRERFVYEEFLNSLVANLERGRIRLVIAVDEPPPALLATVRFVNRFSERFELYLIQLKRFRDRAREQDVFVPALFGRVEGRPTRGPWNEQTFLEQSSKAAPAAMPVLGQLIEFAKTEGTLQWGRGSSIGTFTFLITGPDGRPLPAFFVQSNGRMAFDFWTLGKRLPRGLIDRYREQLARADGIPAEAISAPNWKEFAATALGSRKSWEAFRRAVVAFRRVVETRSAGRPRRPARTGP